MFIVCVLAHRRIWRCAQEVDAKVQKKEKESSIIVLKYHLHVAKHVYSWGFSLPSAAYIRLFEK